MKKKAYIDTYKSIYPFDLIVANKHVTDKDLNKFFTTDDGSEIECGNSDCFTMGVKRKSDGSFAILVRLNKIYVKDGTSKLLELIDSACHEATHYVFDTYRSIGETASLENQEYTAYFIAWAARNIFTTWTKK